MKPDTFFEISWEVCNKVGGIYTVVRSKVKNIQEQLGDAYVVVGPYFHDKMSGEFLENLPEPPIQEIFETLQHKGIVCHYGTWLVDGKPRCILIDFSAFAQQTNSIKAELWKQYNIDSLGTQYYDYDEPIVWSWAVGKLVEAYQTTTRQKVVIQCHEWLSAGALLYLRKKDLAIATIFTTHATMLGRTLASSGTDLYKKLESIRPEEEAKKRGVLTKHQTEVCAAQNAHVFSTVSEITSIEATWILGKKPDIILPNGLNIGLFPRFDELSIQHKQMRNKITEFVQYYFFPYYQFDLENTLYFFLCGRYEFRDKGMDVLIKALGKLNAWIKEACPNKHIIMFFWVPAHVRGIKPHLFESKMHYDDIKDIIVDDMQDIQWKLINAIIANKPISNSILFDANRRDELKKKTIRFHTQGNPPLSTHDMYDEENDLIINALKAEGLDNSEDTPVKVVYYSMYLTGADGLLDTSYYESIMGCDFGIFPSYYEPWGYTPLETAAHGVVSLTTDTAGFGRFVKSKPMMQGIFVLERMDSDSNESATNLFEIMKEFLTSDKESRLNLRLEARKAATEADWKIMIKNYVQAIDMAMERSGFDDVQNSS